MLIKMLFQSKPSECLGKDLELMFMEHFPFKGKTFMMWCGRMVVRKEHEDVTHQFLATKNGKKAKTHEYGHVKQAIDEHGDNWVRYYLNYYWHWIKHCPWMAPSSACYYINRYECQAFAQEDNPDYWLGDTRADLLGKYSIKDAKKKWKELGGTSDAWKAYVKSL